MESKTNVQNTRKPRQKLITIPKKNTLQKLNEYRLSNHLCDVILLTGGREFPAHRAVLEAGGGFFSGLFASNMREQAQEKIELPQVDCEVMDDILSYVYTGQMQVTRETAQLLIMAADFLLLEELKQPLDEFMAFVFEDCLLTPHVSASTLQFAYQYNCTSLGKQLLGQVLKNLEAIISESQEIFLEFNAGAIFDIISSDAVEVSSEEVVFTAIMKWVRYKNERRHLLDKLLLHIRLCSLSEDFIHSVVLKDPLVGYSPECVSIVQSGLNTSSDPTTPNVPHPRDCLDTYTDVILVIVQDYSFGISIPLSVWCYIPAWNSWRHIPSPEKFGFGMPIHAEGALYTVITESSYDTYLHKYDLQSNSWSSLIAQWESPTWFFSKAYLRGSIYLVGGKKHPDEDEIDHDDDPYYDENHPICADEVFACDLSLKSHSFTQVASLNTARSKACVVTDDDYIYAIGGAQEICDYDNVSFTNSMERYDPQSSLWTYLSPVPFCNVGGYQHQCVLVNGKIFVIQNAKHDDDSDNRTFDLIYDIMTDTWTQIPPALVIAENGVVCHLQGNLYLVCGGCDHYNEFLIKSVCYDVKENAWSDVVSSAKVKWRELSGAAHFEGDKLDFVSLAGTAVRLRKYFLSTLQLLEDAEP